MRAILGLRSLRVALGVGALIAVILAALPLAGSLGPESALVLGLTLAPLAAAFGAGVVRDARKRKLALPTATIAARALGGGLLIAGLPLGILLLNIVRVPSCAPLSGLAFELLGPVAGVLVSTTLGVGIATLVRAPRLSTVLAALAPLVEMGLALERFHASPAIFAYGHVFGWFPGTLYDEGTAIGSPYVALRLASLALVVGLFVLHAAVVDPATQRISASRLGGRLPHGLLALLLLSGFARIELSAEELGIRSSTASIRERLGGSARAGRCTAVVPRELPQDEAQRLAEDCAFRLTQMERVLGVRPGRPVTAFFFRDVDEKRALMGAGDTYIAKPWRREVYLQLGEWPHPVLAHEMAHVVAGDVASGPFRVGGQLGGLLPDAGMIEGVAVAMAWAERDGQTPHEWARTMIALDIAPTIEGTRGLSFLLEPAGRAYTISGSFYRFLFDRYGAPVVRRAYLTGDLEAAAGKPVSELAREWRAFVATVQLRPGALELARVRFARGAIFARPCPHRVAQLRNQLAGDLAASDAPRAATTCREVLAIDPADTATRAVLAGALARVGLDGMAAAELDTLERRWNAPAPIMSAAREAIADARWRRGDSAAALRILSELEAQPRADDARRVLEVKLLALRAGGRQAELLGSLLASETQPDAAYAVHIARELAEQRTDGLPAYLEARQLAAYRRHADAVPMLRTALGRGLPTALLTKEARRMLGTSLWASGERAESTRLWGTIARDADSNEAERLEARDWLARARLAP